MPSWSFTRRRNPGDKPALPPAAPKTPPAVAPQPKVLPSSTQARRTGDAAPDGRPLQLQFEEATTTRARLRQDLAELLKAHRQQGRVLEPNQKLLEQTENEISRHRSRAAVLESEVAEQRNVADQHAARVKELEHIVTSHATLQTAYEALDRERQDLTARLMDLTRSQTNATADRDRIAAQLATAHATIASRDAEVAALKVEEEGAVARINGLQAATDELKRANGRLHADLERALEAQAAHHHLQLEFDALSARWDVARAQLAEAEQALKTSQATIKAAQRLSSSVEWRAALDGVLDAASELVRFERAASDPFTDHDLRNLARVATDAANALINARLVDLLKQREDHLTTLVRKARELSTANDSKQVIEFVLSSARELVGGKAALLALRNNKTLELEVIGSHGVAAEVVQPPIAWGAP